MTSKQIRLNLTRPLERHEILRLIKIAIHQREYRFASQVALDWLTEFPGDLNAKYWYGLARAKEGHLQLAASILDELLQLDPEYLEALKTRIVIEQQIQNDTRKLIAPPAAIKNSPDLFEFQEWLIALSGETIGLPKRPYEDLAHRWGEELHYLEKSLTPSQKGVKIESFPDYERAVHELLAAKPDHPLIAITHIRFLYQNYQKNQLPVQALRDLVEHYLDNFPHCLYLNYVYVDCLMETGAPEKAVALLHSLAARDISAQVAKRVWSTDKSFYTIWPHTLYKKLDIPIPAGVAAYLGLNQLPENILQETTEPFQQQSQIPPVENIADFDAIPQNPTTAKDIGVEKAQNPLQSPLVENIVETYNHISQQLKQPQLANLDGRQPVYVILSASQPLQTLFGAGVQKQIEGALFNLLQAVQRHIGWRGFIYYVDEGKILPSSNKINALACAKPSDPWQIKHCLTDLDQKLANQGEMIGSLLIVGGNEIIPFHRLPNPVEDGDEEILSDNPYGSRDENYLVLDWPLGRIPTPPQNAQFALDALSQITQAHQNKPYNPFNWKSKYPSLDWFFSWFTFLSALFNHRNPNSSSFGYTAAAWRFASFAVFREIGNPQNMLISPQNSAKIKPAQAAKQRLVRHSIVHNKETMVPHPAVENLPRTPNIQLPQASNGYFNLHGLIDSAEWFGQSDPTEAGYYDPTQSDHPIALQPGDILQNNHLAFKIIFSEACFGANFTNKQIYDSIALSFLSKGCLAFVGSTATAYGSNSTPLIAADYLAQAFWKNIHNGIPAGEALRQAKLSLAAPAAGKNQSALDAEDQKTIISFILLGDPLTQISYETSIPKVIRHAKTIQSVPYAICDRGMHACQPNELSPQVESTIKKMVEKYLPGMDQAQLSILGNGSECHGSCSNCTVNCGLKHFSQSSQNQRAKSRENGISERKIVILKKENRWQNHTYTQYARLTLDASGKLIKLSISK